MLYTLLMARTIYTARMSGISALGLFTLLARGLPSRFQAWRGESVLWRRRTSLCTLVTTGGGEMAAWMAA